MNGVILAHGAGGGADELFLMLGLGGVMFGALKLLDKRREWRRRLIGIPLVALGLLIGASPFVFGLGVPRQAPVRVASPVLIEIVQPVSGQILRGGRMGLSVEVSGGRIVDRVTTDLSPTEGHLLVSIDGQQPQDVKPVQSLDIADLAAGQHLLEVEFVATDNGSFKPPVRAVTTFTVER